MVLPVGPGFVLPGGVWGGDRVSYRRPSRMTRCMPVLIRRPALAGFATDTVTVQQIESPVDILPEITVQNPSLYQNDADLTVRYGAVGSRAPYQYTVRFSTTNLGAPGARGRGPDGAGPIASFRVQQHPPRPSQVTAPGVPWLLDCWLPFQATITSSNPGRWSNLLPSLLASTGSS